MTEKLSGPMVAPENGDPNKLVVLLHGYGSDGNDLISLVPFLQPEMEQALFVAPNAPEPCAINPDGYQWFALDLERELSRLDGAVKARSVLQKFLEDLWAETGLGAEDTVLIGFSQGAMMALDVGLRLDPPPQAIVSFSGALVAPEQTAEELGGKPPVALIHGTVDDVVPSESAQIAHAHLQQMGVVTALHFDHGGGHTISAEGLGFAIAFLRETGAAHGSGASLG